MSIESIIKTTVIDSHKDDENISSDVPRTFIQIVIPSGKQQVIMKIKEVLVNLLVKITPEVYEKYNFYKNREKVLYVKVLWALYGMLGKYLL